MQPAGAGCVVYGAAVLWENARMSEPKLFMPPDSCTAVLATFRNSAEASLAQASLADAGISCALAGTTVADVTPQFSGGGGSVGVRMLVRGEDVERAGKLLPARAIGDPAVVADLDRQFKRFLFAAVAVAAGIVGLFVVLGKTMGDDGVWIACGIAFLVITAFLISVKPAPAEEPDDDGEDDATEP